MTIDLGSNIEGADDIVQAPLKPAKPRAKAATVAQQERVKIMLEENDTIPPGGLFLGLNGIGYVLRPGVVANVPIGIKNILDDAIMSVPVINPDTMQIESYRDRMRYSYRVVNT